MNDKFDYVYDRGHWLRIDDGESVTSKKRIAQLTAGFVLLIVSLVAVTAIFLCW